MLFKRNKSGRPVDGPRPDKALPHGDWLPFARAFHAQVNRIVSVIMADDEKVLDPLPVVDPGPLTYKPNWVDRMDPDLGCRFRTDIEGEGGYLLRGITVRKQVSDYDRAAYVRLFQAWTATHIETGGIRRFETEDGNQFCWQVGPDDVVGVRLEYLGDDIAVSATRAWVLKSFRKQFV